MEVKAWETFGDFEVLIPIEGPKITGRNLEIFCPSEFEEKYWR
jgi:hypothetical protein